MKPRNLLQALRRSAEDEGESIPELQAVGDRELARRLRRVAYVLPVLALLMIFATDLWRDTLWLIRSRAVTLWFLVETQCAKEHR